jgi:hypothetical protein
MFNLWPLVQAEWKLALRQNWANRGWVPLVIILTLLGYIVPRYAGGRFLDATIVFIFGVLASRFTAPSASETFRSPDLKSAPLPVKVLSSALFGWIAGLALLSFGLLCLNLTRQSEQVLLPPAYLVGSAALISLLLCVNTAAISGIVSLRRSPQAAFRLIRAVTTLAFLGLIISARLRPQQWRAGVAAASTRQGVAQLVMFVVPSLALLGSILLRQLRAVYSIGQK